MSARIQSIKTPDLCRRIATGPRLAKLTASLHHLSGGRFILGIASGDRPVEYPLMGLDYETREATLRDLVDQLRGVSGDALKGPQSPITVRS